VIDVAGRIPTATPPTGVPIGDRLRQLEDRVLVAEHHLEAARSSLNQGAGRFARLDHEIAEAKKPPALRPWIGIALAIVLPLAGWIQTQTSKPDRVEVEKAITERAGTYQLDKQRIMAVVDGYDRDRDSTRNQLEALRNQQALTNEKLDALLTWLKRPRSRR
jgi:hypothetical protein